jgi:hypothetical protein
MEGLKVLSRLSHLPLWAIASTTQPILNPAGSPIAYFLGGK